MTILYASDFEKYPNAIIDTQSPNRSWVEFGAKMKKMGVKNWGFHLTLLDPSLQGVDPYDPKLTDAQKLRVSMEAHNNWWYYLREIFKVPSNSGGKPIYLKANRGNIAIFWCLFNHFITYAQQIRQTGKSLTTRALASGFHICWARGAQHILFTKSDLRSDEIKEYKEIKASVPEYLYYNTAKDKDNQQDFTTLCHGNVTFSYVPQSDPDSANKVGRGKTPLFVNVDEVPFLPYVQISIPSLIGSTTNSFDEAKRNGAFHGILYTTTAGDLSTDEGKYVYEMIKARGMFFSEILYDCTDRKDALELIFANSNCAPVPYVTIAFNHLQLGYTDEWLREKIATVPGTKDQIKRDFLGIWTFGSQQNPIPEVTLNLIRKNVNDHPTVVRMNKYYQVRFHRDEAYVRSRKMVMGLDMSEGINRDAITMVGIDVETTETLFAFSVNESNLIYFGTFLARFMYEFPNATLVPEAKSMWGSVRDQLLIELPKLGVDPGRRIYSQLVDEAKSSASKERDYKEYSSGYPSERKYYPFRQDFGFKTSSSSRDTLYREVMMNVTKEIPEHIKDGPLIDELSTLVEKKGRIDHALSGNDDHVISWLLSHWFLRYARNLEHYGIEPLRVMCNKPMLTTVTDVEIRQIKRQEATALELTALNKRLESARSHIEIEYLMNKIRRLQEEVFDVDDPTMLAPSIAASSKGAKQSFINKRRNGGRLFPL